MKKFLSIHYSDGAFNFAILLLRLCLGLYMLIVHGMDKLMHFAERAASFYDPFGIGHKASLVLMIFAEVFCSIFVILGLFTRFAVLPLIIGMAVAVFGVHKGLHHNDAEIAAIYLTGYLVLLLCGPGRISVDGMMKK
jgi:putative oxidoreductase